jgi:DNA-binding NtrC family response regulator
MKMKERLTDCLTTTDHTRAKAVTILLVEDKERMLRAMLTYLQRRGFEVMGVGTVEEVEQCIEGKDSENIAVIVTNINLHPVLKELEGGASFQS